MKTKLTLLLLCFCSSVFSENYVLTSNNLCGETFTLVIKKLSETQYLGKKEAIYGDYVMSDIQIRYNLVNEDENSLTLTSVVTGYPGRNKELFDQKTFLVIHKKI